MSACFGKGLFTGLSVRVNLCVYAFFSFGLEGWMRDLIVLVLVHCLSFNFTYEIKRRWYVIIGASRQYL